MGSKIQRLKGCIVITLRHFVNVLYGKADRFPHPHKSGIWYLAIMWQNQHFLRGLRGFNSVLVLNPER